MRFETKAIHIGSEPDSTGAVIKPIYLVSTYKQSGIDSEQKYKYSRASNPTRDSFERCIAALENAKYGLAFSSGVAAEMAVLSLLKNGDEIVTTAHLYAGSYRLFNKILGRQGIRVKYVHSLKARDFEKAVSRKTKIIWIETPTNPLLHIMDIGTLAKTAHKSGALLVVDNTFASPYFQNPISIGADIVVHSTTKYISGHSDIIGGAAVTNSGSLHKAIKFYQATAGAIASPFDCFLALRGIKTLAVRMKKHESNAKAVAEFLVSNRNVAETVYPGLKSHPGYEIAKEQMTGFGGMVSFRIKGGAKKAGKFYSRLKLFAFAESLGGIESLASAPHYMITNVSIDPAQKKRIGISEDLVRLSVGIEDENDIIKDLEQALK